ncbi:hypothetical protein [Riemerella columbina]|nr:hypothetical protein [Riemerella columbina]
MKNIYSRAYQVLLPKPSTVKFLLDFSKSLTVFNSENGVFVLSKN